MSLFLTHGDTAYSTKTELFDEIIHPQRVHWLPETYQRAKTGFTYAPHILADMVLRPEKISWIRKNPSLGKTAFILAGGNQHFAGINPRDNQKDTRLHYIYKFLPFTLTNVYAGRIAQQICDPDHISTDATACVSSLKVLQDCMMLKAYGFTRFIILSVEDAVTNSVLEFFGDSGACLTKKKEDELGILPSAFDSKNGGFYVGQGAAFAVLMTEEEVNHYGLHPKARLISAYHCAEKANNAIGQREDGKGYADAIQGALTYGEVNASEITIVKTHGTGTPSNNVSEKAGLQAVLKDFVATSFKQKIGHTMGASGLLETLLLLDNLAYGVIPGILNRTEEDKVFLSEDCEAPDGLMLSVAAGMGNVYSAAIFEPVR
jgi:3-oxoacyl-[acyl-carrier-protein] synthase-1